MAYVASHPGVVNCNPADVFHRRGVMKYLEKCGVKLPEDSSSATPSDVALANSSAEPLWDNNTLSELGVVC